MGSFAVLTFSLLTTRSGGSHNDGIDSLCPWPGDDCCHAKTYEAACDNLGPTTANSEYAVSLVAFYLGRSKLITLDYLVHSILRRR